MNVADAGTMHMALKLQRIDACKYREARIYLIGRSVSFFVSPNLRNHALIRVSSIFTYAAVAFSTSGSEMPGET